MAKLETLINCFCEQTEVSTYFEISGEAGGRRSVLSEHFSSLGGCNASCDAWQQVLETNGMCLARFGPVRCAEQFF